jgi:hypothetical protein
MTELRNLRGRINELETDLRDRDEEVKLLKEQQLKHGMNGTQEDSETIRVSLLNPSPNISINWNYCKRKDLPIKLVQKMSRAV